MSDTTSTSLTTVKKAITVEETRCVGCGTCQATYPDIFELADNGSGAMVANVRESADFSKLKPEDAQKIVDVCPSQAISVEVDMLGEPSK